MSWEGIEEIDRACLVGAHRRELVLLAPELSSTCFHAV